MKDLSLHILDIFQNSLRAKSTEIKVQIHLSVMENRFEFTISDNGCGMDEAMLERVKDPFFTSRTHRKVGLGIPLLYQNANLAGGDVYIESEVGKGTTLKAWFQYDNWDRPPVGDCADLMALIVSSYPNTRILFEIQTESGSYSVDSLKIKEVLDGVSISSPEVILLLKKMFIDNLADIKFEE